MVAIRSRTAIMARAAATVALVAGAVFAAGAVNSTRSAAAPEPPGFVNGTDSSGITISGGAPYQEPAIGGPYGGYVGMVGNWAHWIGCGGTVVWSTANSQQANRNYYQFHIGIGTAVYWFMGGPGVDPNYNGTASEAYAWGARQAARVIAMLPALQSTYPVVFMDIELPGHAPSYTPADDNGWNSVYWSPCSGSVRISFVPTSLDRADLNGFANYLTSHSSYKAGVYSAPDIWASIFGTGYDSYIPNTYEWTYEPFTSSLAHPAYGWCLSGTGTCARFFGGQTSASPYALMWQWTGGGGSWNGYGDFDVIDIARMP